jgi:para-aminobenzoate synthetase component 1
VIVLSVDPVDPAIIAQQLGRRPSPCWLISPGAGEVQPARDFIASDPVAVVRDDASDADDADDAITALEHAWQEARRAWAAGPGVPVGVGFLSYDLGRQFLRLRSAAPPPSGWPRLEFRFYDAFWVRDVPAAGAGAPSAQIWATDERAAAALLQRLREAGPTWGPMGGDRFALTPLRPKQPADHHLRAIARVQEYLRAGDAYQVNLARQLGARVTADGPIGLGLFSRLRADAPAPHGLWLADPARGRALVGNSPERFLRLDTNGVIETAPIKGTRPRPSPSATTAAVEAALGELAASAKDRAEHVMIVDLERNDLGRICEVGSIEVVEPLRGLALPSVLHLVSTVRGRLPRSRAVGLAEILRATFPGGSITGAPKRRAMEIIDELEPVQRGPYTGATGWLGAAGDFDLAIAIRTATLEGEALSLWVGGGIVIDSLPEAELAETEVKARAFAAQALREVV